MKKIINYAIITMLFCVGCSDDLDLYPLTQTTEGTFYQNEREIKQAVDDIYRHLGSFFNGWDGIPSLYGEQLSDNTEIYLVGGGNNFPEQINNFFILSENGNINSAWDRTYNSIFIFNNLLNQLENTTVEIDNSQLEIMKGQILLMRSLFYFYMVQVWGAVPYIENKITYEEAFDYLRVEPSTIYEKLISDLNYSKQVLPASYSGADIGRVTKYAAAAILAKIFLTLNDKEKAKTEIEFIIDSNLYSLDANGDGAVNTEDYYHIFAPNTKNCKSSILEVQYMAGINAMNSNHQNAYTPFHWAFNLPGIPGTFRGGGLNSPSKDLVVEFELNDPRKKISVVPGYVDDSGNFVEFPYTNKFYDPNWQNPGQNVEIIRYADLLLMYSEVTNDPQYLNMVRSRVGLPAFGTNDYPSDKYPSLELAIEHERRIELCFEWHRFFDLKRTNRALTVMGNKEYDINENKLIFPIPLQSIDVNPGLTQNPGYN